MPPTRKILFPTRVALVLVLPSLLLYLFFNIWPMIFSIGLAFTNADIVNIAPSPEKIQDLKNAIACAEYLKTSEEHKIRALELLELIDSTLKDVEGNLTEVKNILVSNISLEEARVYINYLYSLTWRIKRFPGDIKTYFNCAELGYPTGVELIPEQQLIDLDSLFKALSEIPTYYHVGEIEKLSERVVSGLNYAVTLREFFYKLESDFEGYLDKFIESANKQLDRLKLKYIGLENFYRLGRDPRFYNALYKTLFFVATSVPLKVSIGVFLAIFYSSPLIYGRRVWRALLLVPWAMPFLLSAITWKFLFHPREGQLGAMFRIDMYNVEWHAFLVYNLFEAWLAYPFIMTVTMGALSGLSKDVIEAALVDGAGLRDRVFKVVLPLIAKPVTLATILTTGASLQAFLIPLILNGGGPSGRIEIAGVGSAVGPVNEMLILFGYNKIMLDKEYGYAASIYLVVVAIILIYVSIWFMISRKMR